MDHWELVLFSALFAAISIGLIVLAFVILVPIIKSQKVSNGIVNQDSFMQNHLFYVKCKKETLIRQLYLPSANDTLQYTFDESTMTLTLERWGASIAYTVFIRESDGGCYLRLHKQHLVTHKSDIPYFVNEFVIKKLDAEPLPYEQYKDIVP